MKAGDVLIVVPRGAHLQMVVVRRYLEEKCTRGIAFGFHAPAAVAVGLQPDGGDGDICGYRALFKSDVAADLSAGLHSERGFGVVGIVALELEAAAKEGAEKSAQGDKERL